jgi:hypothetical protein
MPWSFTPMLLRPKFDLSATIPATSAPIVSSAEIFPCRELKETVKSLFQFVTSAKRLDGLLGHWGSADRSWTFER